MIINFDLTEGKNLSIYGNAIYADDTKKKGIEKRWPPNTPTAILIHTS